MSVFLIDLQYKWHLLFIFLFFCLTYGENLCDRSRTCSECMGKHPSCSWCYDEDYDDTKDGPGYRCGLESVLITRGCSKSKIENVGSVVVNGT